MKPILVLNGPNLNMLGTRQPEIYGTASLGDLEGMVRARAGQMGVEVEFRQSNYEGRLVTWIQRARSRCAGIIINPAAYTHTSVALRDAILASELPVVEVHIANIFTREEFRHHSFVSPIAKRVICGLGLDGYLVALQFLVQRLGAAG